jgi:hypothetical protein
MGDLDIGSCTDASAVFQSFANEETSLILKNSPPVSRFMDRMVSLAESNRKITGVELYAKSAAALTLGIIPFGVSKLGEGVFRGCAFFAQEAGKFLTKLGFIGEILGKGLRMAIGIPAAISGGMLYAGAWIFSQTQKLVWGKYLVENPQEEKINTQLARFGAKEKLFDEFLQYVNAFFTSSKIDSFVRLTQLRNLSIH